MPRKPRKCGTCFWIWTFLVGVFSPGKGKRRINTRIKALEKAIADRDEIIDVRNSDNEGLKGEVEYLRKELAKAEGKNKQYLTALGMDADMKTVVNMRTPSWATKTPADEVDTQPLPAVG